MQQIEIVVPFVVPGLAAFRKGEVFTAPMSDAKAWIAGGLARPVNDKAPEYATAPNQRKK